MIGKDDCEKSSLNSLPSKLPCLHDPLNQIFHIYICCYARFNTLLIKVLIGISETTAEQMFLKQIFKTSLI